MGRTPGREMLSILLSNFDERFGGADGVHLAMAPGRVNLLGDHTDYNDGFVLPMTVDRGVYVACRKRGDMGVRLRSIRYDEALEYPLCERPIPEAGRWSCYVVGVVEELRLRGLVDTGFEAMIDGDVTLGAGLSSSAALEVAVATALQHLLGFDLDPVEMVKLCRDVEHNYANVKCGIMDQFASRLGRKDHALFLDCRTLGHRDIPLSLGDHRIVIVSSGVKRSLAVSAYNRRHDECRQAVDHFRRFDNSVTALRDVTPQMLDEHGGALTEVLRRRCRHVVAENARVLQAADLLSSGHLEDFGALMNDSHRSLGADYEVSCAELDELVKIAQSTDGVLGARMTGAGFGGCTVNLVYEDAISSLKQRLDAGYAGRFNLQPRVFVLEGNLEAGPLRLNSGR